MALTDGQKAQVRLYLGFPDVNRTLYSNLEGAMTAVSDDAVDQITDILTRLDSLQTTLEGAWPFQSVIRAEEVTLSGFNGLAALRSEGKRLVNQLAIILGVKPMNTPFDTGRVSSGVALRGA
jgi:hypothetical protein